MASYQPQQYSHQYPNLNPGGAILNSKTVQTLQNGPIAQTARNEVNLTKNEFSNLASSRQTPRSTTATGQSLTHYHSFFYNLLSWENPRATAISYATIATLIIATRYIPLTRYALRLVWITLGFAGAVEWVGQLALNQGVVSKMKPKRYYTIPRDTLEGALEDVEQLINFFVIEVQRILFAENVYVTLAAFLAAFVTYFLVKIMPTWGLTLLGTTVVYFVPLVYISNKDLIDSNLQTASDLISEQTSQVRELASHHTNKAVEISTATLKDYSARAQDLIGTTKPSTADTSAVSEQTSEKLPSDAPLASANDEVASSPFKVETEPLPMIQKSSNGDLLASIDREPIPKLAEDTKPEPLLA